MHSLTHIFFYFNILNLDLGDTCNSVPERIETNLLTLCITGPPLAGISYQSNNPSVVEQGLFSTASYATYKMRKDVELWEICYNMLQRVPKSYNKVFF